MIDRCRPLSTVAVIPASYPLRRSHGQFASHWTNQQITYNRVTGRSSGRTLFPPLPPQEDPDKIARIAFGSLALALLCPPANADKFYFGSAKDHKRTVGNARNYVEGVLLKQDKDTYTIRIMGGWMSVAKSMVYKIEKDGLTVAQLEIREKNRMGALAQAEANRRQLQASRAAARREAQQVAGGADVEIEVDEFTHGHNFRPRVV